MCLDLVEVLPLSCTEIKFSMFCCFKVGYRDDKSIWEDKYLGVLVGMSCLSVVHVVSCLVTDTGSDSSAKTLQFVSECGLQTLTHKSLTHFVVDSTHFQMHCLNFAVNVKENN